MGIKLMCTALTAFIFVPVVAIPALSIVAAVLALIGIILVWMDK